MFTEIPKLFDRNFAVGYLIPAAVFLLGSAGLILAFQITALPISLTDPNLILNSAVVLLFSWFIGILFMGANRDIIRALEGYGKINPLRLLLWIEKRKFKRLQEKISRLEQKNRNEKEEDELNRLFREAVTNFPDEAKYLLPTSFGNAIRAFEVYPRLMYGVESVVLWSRLLAVVPEDYQAHVSGAKSHMDFWINTGVSGLLLLSTSIGMRVYATYNDLAVNPVLFWLTILVELILILICPYRATRSAIIWGQTVKSAFDVYLPDLAVKIGLKPEESHAARKLTWQNYCIAILYARDDFLPPMSKPKEAEKKQTNTGWSGKIIRLLTGH